VCGLNIFVKGTDRRMVKKTENLRNKKEKNKGGSKENTCITSS